MSVHPTEALEPGAAHARTRFGLMLLPVQVPFRRLEATARAADAAGFRRYGSARRLYNFKIDNAGAY